MLKSDLSQRLAAHFTHISVAENYAALSDLLALMSHALVQGERIEIRGFGSFQATHKPAHRAFNPHQKTYTVTPAKSLVHFKTAKELRNALNSS